jgi:glucosylceramidase
LVNADNVADFERLLAYTDAEIEKAFESEGNSCFETFEGRGFLSRIESPQFERQPIPQPFMNSFVYVDAASPAQKMWGFGTSLTDAAVEQFESMSESGKGGDALADAVLRSQIGFQGLTKIRIPIGSCDFRAHGAPYSFMRNEALEIPNSLDHAEHWAFWAKNFEFNDAEKLRVKWLLKMQRLGALHITAAPWTAPPAFKTGAQNAEPQGWVGGKLQDKPHVLCSWVNYLCYYVVKYAFDFNLEIASLSLQNEPRRLPHIFAQTWETMFYTPSEYAEAVAMLLFRIKELNLRVKLILFDDQKALLPDWVEPLMRIPSVAEEIAKKGGLGCIEAIGFHGYMWPESSQSALKKTRELYPNLPLVCTEFTTGFSKVLSWPLGPAANGSAGHARQLLSNTMSDLHSGASGFIDWNLILNESGGPNWSGNYCDAVVLYNEKEQSLTFQLAGIFMAHLTRFARERGCELLETACAGTGSLQVVCFRARRKTVVVLNNTRAWFRDAQVNVVVNAKFIKCTVPKGAVHTYVLSAL